jgi:hypothetical protein
MYWQIWQYMASIGGLRVPANTPRLALPNLWASVSQTLQQLIEAGAVEALPRHGREPIHYLITGTARLAL